MTLPNRELVLVAKDGRRSVLNANEVGYAAIIDGEGGKDAESTIIYIDVVWWLWYQDKK